MPRKYKKRDKKFEEANRYRKPSKDWKERKARIMEQHGVKMPEISPIITLFRKGKIQDDSR